MCDHDNAAGQAQAQMDSIREMVAALGVDFDRLEELRAEGDALNRDIVDAGDHAERAAAEAALKDWQSENDDELAELVQAAGDCESEDDARQRIEDDALSVEVRSDWHAPGDDAEPAEFRIVLCTGGPHVEMRGELDSGEPVRAWLCFNDWFQSMRERVNQEGDQDALLAYARVFFFGE